MHSLRWHYWKSVQGPPWSEFLGEIYYNCRFLSGCLTGKEKNSEASLSSADPHTALQRPPEELARWGEDNGGPFSISEFVLVFGPQDTPR